MRLMKKLWLVLIASIVIFFEYTSWWQDQHDPVEQTIRRLKLSPEQAEQWRRDVSHQQYLNDKRELNDAIYGTPEMRAEDALKKAVEDEYTHEPQK
jgi:hypothetical protein